LDEDERYLPSTVTEIPVPSEGSRVLMVPKMKTEIMSLKQECNELSDKLHEDIGPYYLIFEHKTLALRKEAQKIQV
jgi:hypothetical protein